VCFSKVFWGDQPVRPKVGVKKLLFKILFSHVKSEFFDRKSYYAQKLGEITHLPWKYIKKWHFEVIFNWNYSQKHSKIQELYMRCESFYLYCYKILHFYHAFPTSSRRGVGKTSDLGTLAPFTIRGLGKNPWEGFLPCYKFSFWFRGRYTCNVNFLALGGG